MRFKVKRPRPPHQRRAWRWHACARVLVSCLLAPGCADGATELSLDHIRTLSWGMTDSTVLNARDIVVRDSLIYVLDSGVPGVTVVDTAGNLVHRYGRRGEGPREFVSVNGIDVRDDGAIAVGDGRLHRITVFASSGDVIASYARASGGVGALAFDALGRLHVDRRGRTADPDGDSTSTIQILDSAGGIVAGYGQYMARTHAIADALNNEALFDVDRDQVWWIYPYRGVLGVYADGHSRQVAIEEPWIEAADTARPFVKATTPDGMSVMIVREPVVSDIAVQDGRIFLLTLQHDDERNYYSTVEVFDPAGHHLASARLIEPSARLAVDAKFMYALRQPDNGGAVIDAYGWTDVDIENDKTLAGSPERNARPFRIGSKVEVESEDGTGRGFSTGQLAGSVALVNFWATWCRPCVDEMPALDAVQDSFSDSGLLVVGVSIDIGSPTQVESFAREHGANYMQLRDPGFALAREFGWSKSIPRSILLDRRGILVAQWFGSVDFSSGEVYHEIERLVRSND